MYRAYCICKKFGRIFVRMYVRRTKYAIFDESLENRKDLCNHRVKNTRM